MTFGNTSKKRMINLDEKLTVVLNEAIKMTKFDFSIVSGFRSAEEQNEIYRNGFSEFDGYDKMSKHQIGEAFDVAPYRNGKLLWDMDQYGYEWLEVSRAIFRAARLHKVVLEWGITYDMKHGYDIAHFQLLEED